MLDPWPARLSGREYDPDPSNNTDSVDVEVQSSGVIVGTDIGCITGPFVRVIDPDTGADRIIPFFAYEPRFRGGVRVYGADVTGDGIPEILTAPGPGRRATPPGRRSRQAGRSPRATASRPRAACGRSSTRPRSTRAFSTTT